MKKTLNVNIGSMAFTIDEDAYHTLNGYYEDIRSRLYDTEKKDIMDDIEARTADIFRENLAFPAQVVSIDLVKRAIAIIGPAQTFGEKQYDKSREGHQSPPTPARKLYRSRTDNVIGGVCGGLAAYFNIDATVVRLIMFFLVFIGGLSVWVYIIAWIVLPLEPAGDGADRGNSRRDKQ